MDRLFECVRVVLLHRGELYSPAYIQGISGAAFRIAGICPCAPTCSLAMEPQDLVRPLGHEVTLLHLDGEGIDRETAAHEVLARLKGEIRAGRPVVLWHAFTFREWDVVCGFDDGERKLFGRGSYAGGKEYAVADEMRTIGCTDTCPALGAMFIGQKTSQLGARQAELAALQEAARLLDGQQGQARRR